MWSARFLAIFASIVGPALPLAAQTRVPLSQAPVRPAALTASDLETWLDGFVPAALASGDIAGLVVSVVKNGEVLLAKGYGYADVANRIAMDPERTLIHVASISKSFTATAVLQLVEQRRLDLDRDVNDYLDFRVPPAFGRPITLRDLLTHTAGFAEPSYKRYVPQRTLRQEVLTVPDRIYPPGQIPAYSNYGLNLAGYIVERVSGEPFSRHLARSLLEPLGMSRSTFRVSAVRSALEAKNYALASAEPYPPTLLAELSPVDFPAAGLMTTAREMTRFMLAHLDADSSGRHVLSPEMLRLMHASAFVPIPGAQPIALGLFRSDYRGHRVIGHSGDGEGFHADMRLLPDQNIGLFMALNSDGRLAGIFPAAFSLRARLFERFVDRYFPTASAPQEPTAPTARAHARLAAGEYVWSRQQQGDYQEGLALVIRFLALKPYIHANADGTIETPAVVSFAPNGRPQRWREIGEFVWREVEGDAHLVMDARDDRVRAVWSDAAESSWINLRVPFLRSARLNVPLLGLAILELLFTVALWPFATFSRRGQRATERLSPAERRARRLTRIAALLAVAYVAGWMVALVADFPSRVGVEPWIRLIQLVGLVCVVGAGVAGWNVWLTSRARRGGWAQVGSVMSLLALVYLAWFSFAFHLISGHLG